jgi:Ser-tRNA(Ala) deacylase AlaX
MTATTTTKTTEQIYLHQPQQHTLSTRILEVTSWSDIPENERSLFKTATADTDTDRVVVTTTETIFYAQGGGQPSDTGVIKSIEEENEEEEEAPALTPSTQSNCPPTTTKTATATITTTEFHVQNVRLSAFSGRILHFGHFVSSQEVTKKGIFKTNEKVFQTIDTAKRNLHSRIHTAGHVLGLAIRQLADNNSAGAGTFPKDLTELKAQHYPDAAFVEFRGLISGEFKSVIQAQADKLVEQDLAVEVLWWGERELREKCAAVIDLPEPIDRRQKQLMRVVNIVGAGAYPCGGTHVLRTAEIGRLLVRNIKRQKGATKVSYSVG